MLHNAAAAASTTNSLPAFAHEPCPLVLQVQTDAAVTLHKLLRGSPNNQLALAHAAGSFAQLQAAHAALGGSWQPCKAELQAVMTVLSRWGKGCW